MSEGTTPGGGVVAEARESLRQLLASSRKARTMRMLWTLVALAIALVYAMLFVNLIMKGFNPKRLQEELTNRVKDQQFRSFVGSGLMDIGKEVYPAFLEELKKKAVEHEVTAELVTDKAYELVRTIGPKYYEALREVAEEMDLMPVFRDGLRDVAEAIVPAYQEELSRIAPEVFDALSNMKDELVQDTAEVLKTGVRDAVRESLARNEEYIRQETNLTEEEVTQKLVYVVLSAEKALTGMVAQRTDRYQQDLAAIQAMLDQIPDASETDLESLQAELGRVTLHLAKLQIPDSKSELEW